MLKNIFKYISVFFLLSGCTAIKSSFTGKTNQENSPAAVSVKKESRFLNQISTQVNNSTVIEEKKVKESTITVAKTPIPKYSFTESALENASPLQIKYSVLLNTPVEEVKDVKMFEFIDEWYGTKYRLGGDTKNGIDCSAFTQFLFAAVYGVTIPRTAREQYKMTNRISRTELKRGDLIFFNTIGGISHVGVYLQNNKFVHAAASGGVMISDIFDNYWVRRFVGVGRLKESSSYSSGN
jgi:lipoprotein Spr